MEDRSERLLKIRHSTAHIMAEAGLSLFQGTKIAIEPAIEDGFYYDFDLKEPLKQEELKTIEKKMKKLISGNHSFEKRIVSREEALSIFKDQPYKIELINDLPLDEEITLYTQGSFTDLCRGHHVNKTSQLRADTFKLLSIASAHWRGDEKNPMLTRIYGTAWENPEELKKHLHRLKEIEKRDHRRLGKDLDLYSTHEEAGAGLIYWHPKGVRIRTLIEEYWTKVHFKNG